MTLKVFISYAKENKSEALKYFDKLEGLGLEPWLDEKKYFLVKNGKTPYRMLLTILTLLFF